MTSARPRLTVRGPIFGALAVAIACGIERGSLDDHGKPERDAGGGSIGRSDASGSIGAGGAAHGGATAGGGRPLDAGGSPGGRSGADPVSSRGGSPASGGAQHTGGAGAVPADASLDTGRLGVAGAPCTDSDDARWDGPNPGVRGTTIGSSGTFTDSCNASGNLVEYLCEISDRPCAPDASPAPNDAGGPCLTFYTTGNIITDTIDCEGHCSNGACDPRCPEYGDSLRYDDLGVFSNQRDGRRYQCAFAIGTPECATATLVGTKTTVRSLTLYSSSCTGRSFGMIYVDHPTTPALDCAYSCSILY